MDMCGAAKEEPEWSSHLDSLGEPLTERRRGDSVQRNRQATRRATPGTLRARVSRNEERTLLTDGRADFCLQGIRGGLMQRRGTTPNFYGWAISGLLVAHL